MVDIEMVGGLANETVQGWDREVDPIPEPGPEPIGASVMFEDNTDNDDDDDHESEHDTWRKHSDSA
jgi:hypothetical protein